MKRIVHLCDRWQTDSDFRTLVSASGSLAVTAVYALYSGILGIRLRSLWHGTICIYYMVLAVLRGVVVSGLIRAGRSDDSGHMKVRIYI